MSSLNALRIDRTARIWALFLALALNSCGGGVDSGGTGAPATATSSASGPITGFGSVIVNGVHFEDSTARVTDADGAVRSRDDLKLGMTASINGSAIVSDASGLRSTANSIVFASAILGPVNSVTSNSMVVLGQTVEVTPTTVFETGGALMPGDVVEVYALFNAANGSYVATRIERKAIVVSAYRLRGVVSSLNTANKMFDIGSEHISYASVPGGALPALNNGRFVRVQLETAQSNGTWTATRLQDGVGAIEDRDDARIEGLITDFPSPTHFFVEGVAVDATRAMVSGTTPLALGVRVEVEGTSTGGVLVASRVKAKSETEVENEGFELDGLITSVNTSVQTFVVRGVSVDYSNALPFEDGTIADLVPGKQVEVRGVLSPDGTQLQATRVKIRL